MAQTTQDFVKRIDLTALDEVTGSEMNQLIDAATVASDKGIRIVTTDTAIDTPDVPDPDTELEGITPDYWIRYKWVRIPFAGQTTRVKEYNWNPNSLSDDVLLKWELSVDVELINANLADFETVANEAFEDAQAAQTTATNAQTVANNAQTTANNAQTTANTALTQSQQNAEDIVEINDAIDEINEKLPGAGNNVTPINRGGTGASTIEAALQNFGLKRVPLGRFYFYERKDINVDNINSVAGIWTKRQINVLGYDNDALAAYVIVDNINFTLQLVSGRWMIEVEAPANNEQYHKIRLITEGGRIIGYGSAEYADTTYAATKSKLQLSFDLDATTKIQIEHITSASRVAGLGKATNLGSSEIYAQGILTYLGSV